MHDPFGLSRRKALPFEAFERLVAAQQSRTLTGSYLSDEPTERIQKRRAELEGLEAEHGFVYVGEKDWIEAYLDGGSFIRYDQWVGHVFDALGVSFSYVAYSENEGFPQNVWASDFPARLVLTNQLPWKPSYSVEADLDVTVYGTAAGPSPGHLVSLFDYLCCVEYMVAQVANVARHDVAIAVTGLGVTHPACVMAWDMVFMSEYGAEWDQTLLHRRLPGV